MPNVQPGHSDDDATASVLAGPVICGASMAETGPQYPAGIAIHELEAVIGEAHNIGAIGVQPSIGFSEVGMYRPKRWNFAQWPGAAQAKRNPGFGDLAPAPTAVR